MPSFLPTPAAEVRVERVARASAAVLAAARAELAGRIETVRVQRSKAAAEIEERLAPMAGYLSERLYPELFGPDLSVMGRLVEDVDRSGRSLIRLRAKARDLAAREALERLREAAAPAGGAANEGR